MAFRLATTADLPALVALMPAGQRTGAVETLTLRVTDPAEVWMLSQIGGNIVAFVRCRMDDHGMGQGFDFVWFYPTLVGNMTLVKARVIVRLCKAAIVEAASRGMLTYTGRYYVEPSIPAFRRFLVNNFGAVAADDGMHLTGTLKQIDLDRIDISGVLL
jgi:hypothetical protein